MQILYQATPQPANDPPALPRQARVERDTQRSLDHVRYVPRRITHHAGHSGYDILFPYMGLAPARSPALHWLARHIPQSLAWRLWNLRPQGVKDDGLNAELGAAAWARGGRGRVCHFIYGEDTFFFTPLWRNNANRMLASFHFEPQRLIERVSPAAVKALDAVVVVGNNQREYFHRMLPAERVFHVPHHVDTDFFQPAAEPAAPGETLRVVFAGLGNRDFDVLDDLVRRCAAARLPFHFDLVLPRADVQQRFGGRANARVHAGLSDLALLQLYQSADLGVMPVIDCTANNALLEMMAVGLPVVGTDIGAMSEYVGPEGADLVRPRDADAFVDALSALAADAPRRAAMGRANRRRAEAEFSMAACAARMREVYAAVAA